MGPVIYRYIPASDPSTRTRFTLRRTGWRLDPALRRRPDKLVHLELEPDRKFVSQNPFHDLAGIDPAKNR